MNDIIKKVYDVYGNDLPKDRHLYQARQVSPVAMLEIKKEFGSYERFRKSYLASIMEKRSQDAKVTKDGKKKGAEKNDDSKE